MPVTPSLTDLFQLDRQLELDRGLSLQVLRERDHALAAQCTARQDLDRLRFWLSRVPGTRSGSGPEDELRVTEGAIAALGRVLAFAFGVGGMAAFLLGSGRGLVNVFIFLLMFVLAQALLCLVAAVVMLRAAAGGEPAVLPVNPARWLVARNLPGGRVQREMRSVLRLLFLRYGQELGAIFTLGAMSGFFVVLLLSPFTFVWGSTYRLSDGFVQSAVDLLAAPWAGWMPPATVDASVIAATRFHPAVTGLSPTDLAAMGGWWPFLIMCMLVYALLPRVSLWLLSLFCYRRQMRSAFLGMPGSELVLARMKTPLVQTRGAAGARPGESGAKVQEDPCLVLLNWAGALASGDRAHFDEFAAVAQDKVVDAGLGSGEEELARLQAQLGDAPHHLYVAVKSWEPPMADLADFLANLGNAPRCTLFLVPLGDTPVSAVRLEDWQEFARRLPFSAVAVHPLGRA